VFKKKKKTKVFIYQTGSWEVGHCNNLREENFCHDSSSSQSQSSHLECDKGHVVLYCFFFFLDNHRISCIWYYGNFYNYN